MSLLKSIAETVDANEQAFKETVCALAENVQIIFTEAQRVELLETAEEFLGAFAAQLQAGKLKEVPENELKSKLGLVAALDLLRNPEARRAVNLNTIKPYLDTINKVPVDGLSGVGATLAYNLSKMADNTGRNGMIVRDSLVRMFTQDPDKAYKYLQRLRIQYNQLTNQLSSMTTNKENRPAGTVGDVSGQPA